MYTNGIFLFFMLVFLVAFVVLLFFYMMQRTTLINPNQCPQIKSEFALQAGLSLPPIKGSNCPAGVCQYRASSLSAAVNQCNSQPDICQAFIYNESQTTMSYVDPTQIAEPSQITNLYIRQN